MTTTKVTAAPYSTTAYSNEALTATTTATASFDTKDTAAFKILSTFKLFVVGQTSAEKEPTKSMTKWSTDTAATRKTNAVDVSSNVSSFAIVVDLTTKKALGGSTAPVYVGTSPVTQVNTTAAPLLTGVTVGLIGNQIGFWIQNGTTTTSTL
jgi:hypothetical protein